MKGYLTVIHGHYFDYAGRAGRKEFWQFAITHLVIVLIISRIEASIEKSEVAGSIYLLFLYTPSITVTIRRLHDTGRSGFWQLIGLIPSFGTVALVVLLLQRGNPHRNQYGLPPS